MVPQGTDPRSPSTTLHNETPFVPPTVYPCLLGPPPDEPPAPSPSSALLSRNPTKMPCGVQSRASAWALPTQATGQLTQYPTWRGGGGSYFCSEHKNEKKSKSPPFLLMWLKPRQEFYLEVRLFPRTQGSGASRMKPGSPALDTRVSGPQSPPCGPLPAARHHIWRRNWETQARGTCAFPTSGLRVFTFGPDMRELSSKRGSDQETELCLQTRRVPTARRCEKPQPEPPAISPGCPPLPVSGARWLDADPPPNPTHPSLKAASSQAPRLQGSRTGDCATSGTVWGHPHNLLEPVITAPGAKLTEGQGLRVLFTKAPTSQHFMVSVFRFRWGFLVVPAACGNSGARNPTGATAATPA